MNSTFAHLIPPDAVQIFTTDGRTPLADLYRAYLTLASDWGWDVSVVCEMPVPDSNGKEVMLPVLRFRTPHTGKALWVLAGVHGEEPAGPNAFAEEIATMAAVGASGIPMVFFPLCNPAGYVRNWRYPNEYRDITKEQSISAADHVLLDPHNQTAPRLPQPKSPLAGEFMTAVIELLEAYTPHLVIDHHEDEDLTNAGAYLYNYNQDPSHAPDSVARAVVNIIRKHDLEIIMEGKTRFEQDIVEGIVHGAQDESVDEFFAASAMFWDGIVVPKAAAASVVVVENPVVGIPLAQRVAAHREIIQNYPHLWDLAAAL